MSTKIEWADETVNPFVGCSKISQGCDNCYALKMAHRLSFMSNSNISDKYQGTTKNVRGEIQWSGKINHDLQCMEKLFDGEKGKKIFVGSMGDIAHPNMNLDLFTRILDKCYQINNHRIHYSNGKKEAHTFLFLTKRPDRFAVLWEMYFKTTILKEDWNNWEHWPTQNDVYKTFWVGTSIENHEQVNKRIQHLISTPVAKRFISIEPLLGPVDLAPHLGLRLRPLSNHQLTWHMPKDAYSLIDWIICGGESGGKARPIHPQWIRTIRDQCRAAGVPFFFKQWGEWMTIEDAICRGKTFVKQIAGKKMYIHEDGTKMIRVGKKAAGRLLDGVEYLEYPE